MTVNEIIADVDLKEPNSYSSGEKLRWLSSLDGKIFAEVLQTHEGLEEDASFTPYTDGTETPLIPFTPGTPRTCRCTAARASRSEGVGRCRSIPE